MKIVITGALGHIGSALLRRLPQLFPGADLTLVDNLSTQRYPSLFRLPPEGRYRFFQLDVLTDDLTPVIKESDCVIHLAAITDAATSFDHREHVHAVNCTGAERVAKVCLQSGSAMLFPSTTSVYGVQSAVVDESCPPDGLKPQSPYAEAKLGAESILQALSRQEGLRVSICRFGTIFGTSPGMRFHTAVNRFCWEAAMGLPITVWRTAMDQVRPYLDLLDAVAAIGHIIRRDLFDGKIYNVVTTNQTVREILAIISSQVAPVDVRYVDTPIMNQLSYSVSNNLFRGTGFRFQGDITTGIRDTIELIRVAAGRPSETSRPS